MARLANRKKYQNKRETFLQLYNRTCERVFRYAFELCLNHEDAVTVCREAYIDMYFQIATLRTAPSVEYWQRKQVDKTMRYLARKGRLSLLHEKSMNDAPDSITSDEKEDIWRRINRTVDIDPWRLVPIPGKSTIFSVLADQAVSDLSYMSFVDIAKMISAVVLIIGLMAGGCFGLYYYFYHNEDRNVDPMEEIFLDERRYSDYNAQNSVQVTDEEIHQVIRDAFGGLDDEAGMSSSGISKSTAKSPIYTNDAEINDKLKNIIAEIIKDDMSDIERLRAIYQYVGKNIRYADVSDRSEDYLTLLKYYFKTNTGDSRHYSAFFRALCNAAGYECEIIKGRFVLNYDTEFRRDIRHYWNKIPLNGMYYYFDCEADSDEFGTEVREYYFMATDGNKKWEIWNRDHDES